MAKNTIPVDKDGDLLKEIQQRVSPQASTILIQAAASFPNGNPPSTKALFDRAHEILSLTERYSYSFSKVLAGMDPQIAVRLPVEIRKVEIEESSTRAKVTYHTFIGPDKDNLEHEEETRTDRTDTAEGKRVYELAKSLIGKRATIWKYNQQHPNDSMKKIGIISNIISDETPTKKQEQTQSEPASVSSTEPDNKPLSTETPTTVTTQTENITTGKALIEYGESIGYSKEQIKAKTVEICGNLAEGQTSRPAEQFQTVANILLHEKNNGPIEKEVLLEADSIQESYNEVFIEMKPMANRLNELGMEKEQIKTIAEQILPPYEKGKTRTPIQVQALYLACLDQLKKEYA